MNCIVKGVIMSKRAAKGTPSIKQITIKGGNGVEYKYFSSRITVGHDPISGKQIQRTFTGKTEKEVSAAVIQAQNQVNNGEFVLPSKLTLAQYMRMWLADRENQVSLNTFKIYSNMIKWHIVRVFGEKVKLTDIKHKQVNDFIHRMEREGYSSKTIRNAHGVLCKALNDAEKNELIRRNPAEKCELPKLKHKVVVAWTDEEFASFVKLSKKYKWGDALLFIALTGLREAECLGLRFDQVDLENDTISIVRQLQKLGNDLVQVENTKTDKSRRTIKIAHTATEILRKRQLKQAENRFASGEHWQGWKNAKERESYYVFCMDNGKPVIREHLLKTVKRIGEQMGKPNLTVHDLRHVYATLCLSNGTDLKTVSEVLGHSSVSTTADIYADVSQKLKTENAEKMEAYILRVI